MQGVVAVGAGHELGQSCPGVRQAAAAQQGGDDLPAHRPEFGQRPVAMGADAEIHLSDGVKAVAQAGRTDPVGRVVGQVVHRPPWKRAAGSRT